MTQEAFKAWWYNEGSQAPYTHHDCEEHTMRMCEIAWANGAFKEREACAKVCEQSAQNYYPVIPEASGACTHLAAAIRARGQA